MNRRNFLIAGATGTGLIAGGGIAWLNVPATDAVLTMDNVAAQLESFRGKTLVFSGKWKPAYVFRHNAQSIDYSMTGFPQPKSPFFQKTVGKTAFAVFGAKRAMRHGLAEPIPGGAAISNNANTDEAIDVLLAAIARFKAFTGPLQPHFAYGELNKADYELAHVLHFMNHMSEIKLG